MAAKDIVKDIEVLEQIAEYDIKEEVDQVEQEIENSLDRDAEQVKMQVIKEKLGVEVKEEDFEPPNMDDMQEHFYGDINSEDKESSEKLINLDASSNDGDNDENNNEENESSNDAKEERNSE